MIIFNQGEPPDREGLIVGTLAPFERHIPVVGGSFANGVALAAGRLDCTHRSDRAERRATDFNVIAELPGRNTDNVVMAGAHLDSVTEGPGINDNGSGSAALLETALMMAKVKPENTIRFAWWGAEEHGLVGSTAYVAEQVASGSIDEIALYLNYDMVGSPNYVFFVYDGDNSDNTGAPAGPAGSQGDRGRVRGVLHVPRHPVQGHRLLRSLGLRAVHRRRRRIPSGGLFTGAEGIKTAAEAATWGGTAGAQYDPCYHLACDTFANNSNHGD